MESVHELMQQYGFEFARKGSCCEFGGVFTEVWRKGRYSFYWRKYRYIFKIKKGPDVIINWSQVSTLQNQLHEIFKEDIPTKA